MHGWFWLSIFVLLFWGVLGVVQKVAVTHIPAENAFVWAAAGFMLLQPILFPTGSVLSYSPKSIVWALLNGAANAVGLLSLLAAMRHGGKASVVEPLSALYPAFVVLLAPALLHERIHALNGAGVVCAVIAGVLLSADKPSSTD